MRPIRRLSPAADELCAPAEISFGIKGENMKAVKACIRCPPWYFRRSGTLCIFSASLTETGPAQEGPPEPQIPPVKFIHAADTHLDSPLSGLTAYRDAPLDLLRTATRQAFTPLVDEAIEEAVSFMTIASDLYDGHWKD
jgi:hypothetical protein